MAVYLLHFEQKISHAQHYIGFTKGRSVENRVEQHRAGSDARIVREFASREIAFTLAREWPEADRVFERHLKTVYKSARRLCPLCREARL